MKNKPYCIITIFFLLFSSLLECSIELKFEKKIIPQEPFNPFKIKINAHGIFFKPFGQAVVVLIDNDGKILKKYARKGQGPGELPFITDFCINNNTITCVGNKKLVIFYFEGMLKEEEQFKKKRIRIQKIFISEGKQYFVNLKAQKKEKNIFRILELTTNSGKKIWSILDVSVQKAWSPNYGAKAPFPWFPSPYYNRPIFVSGDSDKAAIFMTRRSFFYIIEKEKLKRVSIDYSFKSKKITEEDKVKFFSSFFKKPHKKTMSSVIFPKKKENFQGVIKWDDKWAIIYGYENKFLIIDCNGKFKYSVPFSKEMKKCEGFYLGLSENYVAKYKKRLVFINEEGEILLYKITENNLHK